MAIALVLQIQSSRKKNLFVSNSLRSNSLVSIFFKKCIKLLLENAQLMNKYILFHSTDSPGHVPHHSLKDIFTKDFTVKTVKVILFSCVFLSHFFKHWTLNWFVGRHVMRSCMCLACS